MTHVQATEPASPPAVRPWLAMLLVLLVAMLPGAQVTAPRGQDQHLSTPGHALAAIHGRDIVARKDAVETRPVVQPAPASSACLPPPQLTWAPAPYAYHPRAIIWTCALSLCARAPPTFA